MSEKPTLLQEDSVLSGTPDILFSVQEGDNDEATKEFSESIDDVVGDNSGVHNLLDKKHFSEELQKLRRLFFKGDIIRDDYKNKKKDLYVERAIQRSIEIFSSAEDFLIEDPDISSKDLAKKVRQYAKENNLILSDDQEEMINSASEKLDERRQIVIDLLDEASSVLPVNVEKPQALEAWDETINSSIELKLFLLAKTGYNFPREIIKTTVDAIQDVSNGMYESFKNIYIDVENSDYKKYGDILHEISMAMFNNPLRAFQLSAKCESVLPVEVGDYFKEIFNGIKLSFTEKPLVLTAEVSSRDLWEDTSLLGSFLPKNSDANQYLGMRIMAYNINRSAKEVLNTKDHEYKHFLEHNFYDEIREEYSQNSQVDKIVSNIGSGQVSEENLWSAARNELNAYLHDRDGMHKGSITPLLTNKILEAIGNDEGLRIVAESLKVVHDRIILLLSLGYSPKDIAKTIYAARNIEDANIALFRDYDLSIGKLSVKKKEEFFVFLRPDNLVKVLKDRQLLKLFCQSIPSVNAIAIIYDNSPEAYRQELFKSLKNAYEQLKDGDSEIKQEIIFRHVLSIVMDNRRIIDGYLEGLDGVLKKQLQNIYRRAIVGVEDFTSDVESTQNQFFIEWIKPIEEIKEILPEETQIYLSVRHIESWQNFSDEDKKEVVRMFVLRKFTEGQGFGICVDAVNRYNKEKEIKSNDNNLNIHKNLIESENSNFFAKLAYSVPETINWSNKELGNIGLAYATLRVEFPNENHFAVTAFVIGNAENLKKRGGILQNVLGEQKFSSIDRLGEYWTLNVSSASYFMKEILTTEDVLLKNNVNVSTSSMVRVLTMVHSFLKGIKYANDREISTSEALVLTSKYKSGIIKHMFEIKDLSGVIKVLRHNKYNSDTGEKLIGFTEMDNFLEYLLSP